MTFIEYAIKKCIDASITIAVKTPFWDKREDVFKENSYRSWLWIALSVLVFSGIIATTFITGVLTLFGAVEVIDLLDALGMIWFQAIPVVGGMLFTITTCVFLMCVDMDKAEW